MEPIVSCICVTRNRRGWLPVAIRQFQAQQFASRELIVLSDGEDVSDLIPNDSRIRHLPMDRNAPIGTKRNLACAEARGIWVAHWDDDDYSSPWRLTYQAQALAEHLDKSVHGFHTMKFTDGSDWWQYRGAPSSVLGTSLFYRKSWWEHRPFPDCQVGEDSAFVAAASGRRQVMIDLDINLMYATVHPANTSQRVISGGNWVPLPGFEWADSYVGAN